VSFAIPSRVAQEVYERLKAEGRVSRGWLGVQLSDVPEETARKYGLPDTRGAVILWVIDDPGIPSPASDAGIRVGDIVTVWDDTKINTSEDLIRLVAKTEVGATVTAKLLRRGEPLQVQVTVAERPPLRKETRR
jgi:serine protease Do